MNNRSTKDIQTHWHLLDDADAVANEAAQRILKSAAEAISERGVFRLVLAGGHTPEATYRLLVGADTDWSRWEIYFGDERCLPVNDPDRNSIMADNTFLNAVAIPAENVYPMKSEKGAEAAAKEYEAVVKAAMPFDVVVLGIGEDGHTGSLFPGQKHPEDQLVCPVHNSPKPPSDRVTMGVRALSNAQEVIVLATGEGKRDAIKAWREGKSVPIAEIGNPAPVNVLMDRATQSS
ncbi:MAG: 6-phosphogluconolactonase [Epsilonproteobacteria bacterium]|nr:MAG: 6-phosphogluconolactonase [Campylobacterota bacterium]